MPSIRLILLLMPRKSRQLRAELEHAGFVNRGGTGSHRNYEHSNGQRFTIFGKTGDDAKHYQEKMVTRAIKDSSK